MECAKKCFANRNSLITSETLAAPIFEEHKQLNSSGVFLFFFLKVVFTDNRKMTNDTRPWHTHKQKIDSLKPAEKPPWCENLSFVDNFKKPTQALISSHVQECQLFKVKSSRLEKWIKNLLQSVYYLV